MPKRTDISSILIIGSGPIVIGQACEFDYSGAQACKALRQEGYRVVLVNSNPATIMTDPEMAEATYVEPLTVDILEKIIAKEKEEKEDGEDFKYISINKLFDDDNNRDGMNVDVIEKEEKNETIIQIGLIGK